MALKWMLVAEENRLHREPGFMKNVTSVSTLGAAARVGA